MQNFLRGTFETNHLTDFKRRALSWSNQFDTVCFLDNNQYPYYPYSQFEGLLAIGKRSELSCWAGSASSDAFESLQFFFDQRPRWLLGFLAYDLKNDIEKLHSHHPDGIGLPDLYFFEPQILIRFEREKIHISSCEESPEKIFRAIEFQPPARSGFQSGGFNWQPKISKKQYLETIRRIKAHILEGDLYEMNFCQEFFAEPSQFNPLDTFQQLNDLSRAPFASFMKVKDKFLMCASPERFMLKKGSKLVSQPIKGTIRRGRLGTDDDYLAAQLLASEKDRAENVMIVDLVRNDLARSCRPGTVKVEELFGIYPFEQVLHMISTVSGELRPEVHFIDAIKNAFPMGSMTGAPKVMSMELIEAYEHTKRGLYSGAVGYITPEGDFDFNVVIRSLLYNASNKYLSYQAGGAIVYDSEPEQEYAESLLKARALEILFGRVLV